MTSSEAPKAHLGVTQLTIQAILGNVALSKDKCTHQHNNNLTKGSTGRPVKSKNNGAAVFLTL